MKFPHYIQNHDLWKRTLHKMEHKMQTLSAAILKPHCSFTFQRYGVLETGTYRIFKNT